MTIQVKAIEQHFYWALFIILFKKVQTFKSMDETLVCNHSNESYSAVRSYGTVFMLYKVVQSSQSTDETLAVCDQLHESY